MNPALAATPVSNSGTAWHWLLPFAAALAYPWTLAQFHLAYSDGHEMTAAAALALLGAYAVPALGLWLAWRLGAQQGRGIAPASLRAARLAQLVIAAPPLYTLLGVFLYLMKINDHDGAVWVGLWCTAAVGAALLTLVSADSEPLARPAGNARRYAVLRSVHGISALLLLAVFLGPHLFNHLAGLGGLDLHRAIMKTLRLLYRNGVLQPLIIAMFFFQIISGLVLYRRKSALTHDLLDVLQTGSGLYLSVFIAGHINSVFTLGRYFGTDTDYAWAVGAPTGLLADAWNIRLLPHYSLAVFFLVAHLMGAARLIAKKHGMAATLANQLAWWGVAAGLLMSSLITAGMLGARLSGWF